MIPAVSFPMLPQTSTEAPPSEGVEVQILSQDFDVLLDLPLEPELDLELTLDVLEDEPDLSIEDVMVSTPLVEAMRLELLPESPTAEAVVPFEVIAEPKVLLAPPPQPIELQAEGPKDLEAVPTSGPETPEAAPLPAAVKAKAPQMQVVTANLAPEPSEPSAQLSELPESFTLPEAQALEERPSVAKPAEVAQPVKTTTPLVRNVLDRLSEIEVQEGKTRILLRPQGLGAVEIDILRRMDGQIQLAIRVENPMILEALRQEGQALEAFMGERGFDLAGGGAQYERYAPPAETKDSEELPPEEVAQTDLLQADRLDIVT